jgi:hypothetical protein
VAIHLVSLYLVLEREAGMQQATRLMQQLARHRAAFFWLEPPENLREVTVRNVLDARNAEMHLRNVHRWATSAWHAWKPWHEQVREWAKLVA